jgi:hypothetical protein
MTYSLVKVINTQAGDKTLEHGWILGFFDRIIKDCNVYNLHATKTI